MNLNKPITNLNKPTMNPKSSTTNPSKPTKNPNQPTMNPPPPTMNPNLRTPTSRTVSSTPCRTVNLRPASQRQKAAYQKEEWPDPTPWRCLTDEPSTFRTQPTHTTGTKLRSRTRGTPSTRSP